MNTPNPYPIRSRRPAMVAQFIAALLTCFASCAALRAGEPSDPNAHYLGMNVWFCNDWSRDNAFVDLMRHARSWSNYNWTGPATVDADGWPLQDCSTVFFSDSCATGIYKLVFTGQASAVNMMWAGGSVTNLTYNAGTNTSTADVHLTSAATGGLSFLNAKRTATASPGSGLSNVRLYRPGYPTDGSVLYTDEFLALVGKFHLLRFMDWVHTNDNPIVSWSQRPRPGQAAGGSATIEGHTGSVGHPMEYFIQLCNTVQADLFINIPIRADDDYISKTAQLIRYGSDGVLPYSAPQTNPVYPSLDSGLKVYVEYGNEIWNSALGFQCYHWAKEYSDAIIASPGLTHPIEYDGIQDQYTLCARWAAFRSVEMSVLFRAVFGDAAMMTRVRPLLMGQTGGNWFNPRQLPWLEKYYATDRPETDPFPNLTPKPVNYHLYGAGGAAYYGVANGSSPVPDDFFAAGNYPAPTWWKATGVDALRAMNYGLQRVAYEGGMGLSDSYAVADKLALNADPRMQDLTEKYHDVWTQAGGGLLVYYCAVGPENWEFTHDVDQLDSPKLLAIDNLRDNLGRVPVTLGEALPGTLLARVHRDTLVTDASGTFYNQTFGSEDCISGIGVGEWIAFPVHAATPGQYNLSVRLSSGLTQNLQVLINGASAGTITVTGQGVGNLFNTPSLTVPVTDQVTAIRLAPSNGDIQLRSLTFTYQSPFDLEIVTSALPDGEVGHPFDFNLQAAHGTPPYQWSISGGSLPNGLNLTSATGAVTGTPTVSGTFPFEVTVSDAGSAVATRSYSLSIAPLTPLVISSFSLPDGRQGVAYTAGVSSTGGVPPCSWSVSSGQLPAGVTLNPSTGSLAGTPTGTGSFTFSLTVTDSYQPAQSASEVFTIDIHPAAPASLTTTTASGSQIALAWIDQSGGTTSFSIERSPDGSTGWTVVGTTAPGVTSFLDAGLTAGNIYFYRVQATNGLYSDYSNTASAFLALTGSTPFFTEDFCAPLAAPPWTTTLTGGAGDPTLTVDNCQMVIGSLSSTLNASGSKAHLRRTVDNSINHLPVFTGSFDLDFSGLLFDHLNQSGQGAITLYEHWMNSGNAPAVILSLIYSGYNDVYKFEARNGVQYGSGTTVSQTVGISTLQSTHPRLRFSYRTVYTNNGGLNWTAATTWEIRSLPGLELRWSLASTVTRNASNGDWNPFNDPLQNMRYGCVNHSTWSGGSLTGSIVWEGIECGGEAPGGGPGQFRFGQPAYTVMESSGLVQLAVPVWRIEGSTGAVAVDYATTDGTALAGTDYTAGSGTLAWADGEDAVKTILLDILGNRSVEGDENFTVTLNNPTNGASLGSPVTATITIGDYVAAAPPPPPTMAIGPALSNQLSISFLSQPGLRYTLRRNTATPRAADANWVDTGEVRTGDGSLLTFTVAKPVAGAVFYVVTYE